jgi:pSer/pThr/pTyr-binding forkhead associated (FHA) protein
MGPALVIAVLLVLGVGAVVFRKRAPAPPSPPESRGAEAIRRNWLVGIGGPVEGRSFHVGSRTVTIGRAPTNFVQIEDPGVSRVHAQVSIRDGAAYVARTKPGHRLLVNGQDAATTRLAPGDELQIGTARFVFRERVENAVDAGLGRKAAGAETREATLGAGSAQFVQMLRTALEQTGWDVDAAAARLGLQASLLRHLMDEHQLRPPATGEPGDRQAP